MRDKMRMLFSESFLRNILLASVAAVIIIPVYIVLYMYPSFEKMLVMETKDEAVRIATHLKAEILSGIPELRNDLLPHDLPDLVENAKKDFAMVKIKIYKPSGEVIYSSDIKEIGNVNTEKYFREIVAAGKSYAELIDEDDKSLEGQLYDADVVETYVPIMRDNKFMGAFEIYLDVTQKKRSIDKLISQSHAVLIFISLSLLAAVIVTSFKAGKNVASRKRAEEEVRSLNERLKGLYEEAKACSLHDPLTGLANRRFLEVQMEKRLEEVKRYGENLSVILLDIDNFKRYNDSRGHVEGDGLLAKIAKVLVKTVRGVDSVFRYGGEEFLVLLPRTSAVMAVVAAERLRKVVEAQTEVTISLGIATAQMPLEGNMIDRADKALYRAKRNGRNRVEVWSE